MRMIDLCTYVLNLKAWNAFDVLFTITIGTRKNKNSNTWWCGLTLHYMYNNFLHSRFIVLKYMYSDDGKGRK